MLDRLKRLGGGFRTLVSAAAVCILGIADYAGTIDLHAILAYFIKDEHQLAFVVSSIPLWFAALRWFTTGPVLTTPPAAPPPVKAGVDEGN